VSLLGALLLSAAASAHVPFVGCAADGQAGPHAAPRPRPMPAVPVAAARRLAWYVSEFGAVLAPRGWHCFQTYGSNGGTLYAAPERLNFERAMSRGLLHGPGITVSESIGATSGRFEVAATIARYFPRYRNYIAEVRRMMGFDIGPMPAGPYPADRFISRTATEVRLITPPRRRGEATAGILAPNRDPAESLVILDPRDDKSVIAVHLRLPRAQAGLAQVIFAAVRQGNR
jgi:hypothetical protein